ncbi:MAG: molybdenum ABC transporter ATP-binding protein [Planctomycetota bacterium]|jgi:molybdate transport system ATP-binding protein
MSLTANVQLRRGAFTMAVDMALKAPITALFGPSGSGKTTLLHCLAGLVRPQRGRIAIGDRVLFDAGAGSFVPPRRRRVGLVFQDLRLFPHRSVADNLTYGWKLVAADRRRLEPRDVIDAMDLGRLLERRPDEISGGERQRVALGRALLGMPDLLLMDEPLASLDLKLRRQILPYLRWVQERSKIPIVYVSHSLPEILELTDQVVVLDNGRVCGQGEVFEVVGSALHGALDEPFSTDSLVQVRVDKLHQDGQWLRAMLGGQQVLLPFAPLSPGTLAKVVVGPDDVMLATERLDGVSARNQLHGKVARITALHGRLLVHVQIGDDAVLRAEITQAALADLGVEVGSEIYCVVKTAAFRWV